MTIKKAKLTTIILLSIILTLGFVMMAAYG